MAEGTCPQKGHSGHTPSQCPHREWTAQVDAENEDIDRQLARDPREMIYMALNIALKDTSLRGFEQRGLARVLQVFEKAVEFGDTVVLLTAETVTAIEADGDIIQPTVNPA